MSDGADAGGLYDAVPYPSRAFADTHPDHLAALAHLFGLPAPPPATARVLELGCASGGNLLPMAVALPDARFVGIDASPVQVEVANTRAAALGLRNIAFEVGDIGALRADLGSFDFIHSHGVWSWVPEPVQQAMFAAIRRHLTEDGVAYISYNVMPGWYGRLPVRELMLFHASAFAEPKERIGQARAILRFLSESIPSWEPQYRAFVGALDEQLTASWDEYLFHEYLAPHNRPVYFTDFVRQAAEAGLGFLGEAELSSMVPRNLGPKVEECLDRLAQTVVAVEQYMDFIRYRSFRKTLLVHGERSPQRDLGPHRLPGLRISGPVAPRGAVQLDGNRAVEFGPVGEDGSVTADSPVTKAAWLVLSEVGRSSIAWEALVGEARARVPAPAADAREDATRIGQSVLAAAGAGLVRLHVDEDRFTPFVSDRPQACPWARDMASREGVVTNRRHTSVPASAPLRALLVLCDGTRDIEALARGLSLLEQGWTAEERLKCGTLRKRRAFVAKGLRTLASEALLIG